MNNFDITDQVLSQLEYYAERIAYLQSVGDLESAKVLNRSASLMAEAADSREEWVIVEGE